MTEDKKYVLNKLDSMSEEELLRAQERMREVLTCGVSGRPQLITVLRKALRKVGKFVPTEDIPEIGNKELGDEVIWESGSGYEIGYQVKGSFDGIHESVHITSGSTPCDIRVLSTEVRPYTEIRINELAEKYGYEKTFSSVF